MSMSESTRRQYEMFLIFIGMQAVTDNISIIAARRPPKLHTRSTKAKQSCFSGS